MSYLQINNDPQNTISYYSEEGKFDAYLLAFKKLYIQNVFVNISQPAIDMIKDYIVADAINDVVINTTNIENYKPMYENYIYALKQNIWYKMALDNNPIAAYTLLTSNHFSSTLIKEFEE